MTLQDVNSQKDAFEDLLFEYQREQPKKGEFLKGKIVHIEENFAFVDVGAKQDALVPRTELNELEDGELDSLTEGDQVHVYVVNTPNAGKDLVVSLDRGLEFEDWEKAKDLYATGEVIEKEIVGFNNGGLFIHFGRLQGFVPNSLTYDLRGLRNRSKLLDLKKTKIGEKMCLKIVEIDRSRQRLILSEIAAQKERRKKRLQELIPGTVITGQVSNLVNFGAFVDLDGVDGLIHISKLAWQRVSHPSEVVQYGEEIEVLIEDVDVEQERVSLSRKALLPSPWETFAEKYEVGDLLEGTIINIRDFGVFVSVEQSIVGLIHASEMETYAARYPEETYNVGEKVLTKILSIDIDRERLGLSTRQIDPVDRSYWEMKEDETLINEVSNDQENSSAPD